MEDVKTYLKYLKGKEDAFREVMESVNEAWVIKDKGEYKKFKTWLGEKAKKTFEESKKLQKKASKT